MNLPASRRGFILIIVIGILGVMALIAITFSNQAASASRLAQNGLLDSIMRMSLRSGIELGSQTIWSHYRDSANLAVPNPYREHSKPFSLPSGDTFDGNVRIKDSNGSICINDGVAAGESELGSSYSSAALDPWPPTAAQDESAWINLRLRRILNAYGDVHRFADQKGWPVWQGPGWFPPGWTSVYGQPNSFQHSLTASGQRFESLPPRLLDGSVASAAASCGLGDRLIASRPVGGFKKRSEYSAVLDAWASEHLSGAYLGSKTFSDLVATDIATDTWEDRNFHRMTHEFGKDGNGDGHADFDRLGNANNTASLRDQTPNFTDLWKHHAVHPVNLNSASEIVRAAVFLAPTNISFMEERTVPNRYHWETSGGWWNVTGFDYQICSARDRNVGIGVRGFSRTPDNQNSENGERIGSEDTILTRNLLNKPLSVRDAMVMARAYSELAGSYGWPDSSDRFEWHLRRIMDEAYIPEKLQGSGGIGSPPSTTNTATDRWFPSKVFPSIMNTERRLPFWMGAPLAFLRPYGPRISIHIDDFTFKSIHPKVSFLATGTVRMTADVRIEMGDTTLERSVETLAMIFSTRNLATQADFMEFTDSASLPVVQIGPETAGHPSPVMGTVGLKDRGDAIPGGAAKSTRYDFDGTVQSDPTSNFAAQDPSIDPWATAGPNPHTELLDAEIESTNSIFPGNGDDANDLSPFGGLFLSAFGRTSPQDTTHQDSFYFRPDQTLLDSNTRIGAIANKGLVSIWVRIPTQIAIGDPNPFSSWAPPLPPHLNVIHMNFWEKIQGRVENNNSSTDTLLPGDTILDLIRPVSISIAISNLNINNWPGGGTVAARMTVGVGNASLDDGPRDTPPGGGYTYESWPQLTTIPFPWTQTEFDTNPLYREAMFPWDRRNTPGKWFRRFTVNDSPSHAIERGFTKGFMADHGKPYLFRPGSWMRIVCNWDASVDIDAEDSFEITTHTMSGLRNQHHNPDGESDGTFNPKMVISLGEKQFQGMPSYPNPPTMNDLYTYDHLNSQIDNLVMQFGGHPNSGFVPVQNNNNSRQALYDAVEAISGFSSRRYPVDSTNQPAWIVDPQLAPGDKVLAVGSRIHDVPFTPHYGNGSPGDPWMTWDIKSPRVDVQFVKTSGLVPPNHSALACPEHGITLNSREWSGYDVVPADGGKVHCQYRNVDTNGDSVGDVLTDIPWLTAIWWRFVPSGGTRYLSWIVD